MKRRKPYPKRRHPRKTVFSHAMWERWLADNGPDATTERLREGIEAFRQRLLIVPGRQASANSMGEPT